MFVNFRQDIVYICMEGAEDCTFLFINGIIRMLSIGTLPRIRITLYIVFKLGDRINKRRWSVELFPLSSVLWEGTNATVWTF